MRWWLRVRWWVVKQLGVLPQIDGELQHLRRERDRMLGLVVTRQKLLVSVCDSGALLNGGFVSLDRQIREECNYRARFWIPHEDGTWTKGWSE